MKMVQVIGRYKYGSAGQTAGTPETDEAAVHSFERGGLAGDACLGAVAGN